MNSADVQLGTFLDSMASEQSTPGGGCAAALAGSQAAALICMALRLTLGRAAYAAVHAEMMSYLNQAEALRGSLREQIDRDAAAFDSVMACYALPKASDAQRTARRTALSLAYQEATEVPARTAALCLTVMELVPPVATRGNVNAVGDVATALFLARAGLQSALGSVAVNLIQVDDPVYVRRWTTHREQLLAGASQAYQDGLVACQESLGIML